MVRTTVQFPLTMLNLVINIVTLMATFVLLDPVKKPCSKRIRLGTKKARVEPNVRFFTQQLKTIAIAVKKSRQRRSTSS